MRFTRSHRLLIGLIVIATIVLTTATHTSADEAMKRRIDRLVQPYLDAKVVVGMTVGVWQKGKATVVGYGQVAHDDPRRPDGDTVYEIGSVSKVFTGVLLGDAVARGRLKLEQPVQELLPKRVKMPTYRERPITLRDLTTHVSGLPTLPDNFRPSDATNPYADYTVEQMYEFLKGYKPERAPGTKYEYSNLAVGLLGHVLALNAGQTYEQLLRERIATPLGMSDTNITLNAKLRSRLAKPHLDDGTAAANWDLPTLAGAGAIRSTVKNMLRFVRANLNPPPGDVGKAIETAWQVHQKPLAAGDFAIGLGWHLAQDGQTRWHNGQTGGYHAMMLVNRQLETGVVLLANTATMEVDRLAEGIIKMCAGAPVEPRTFDKPVPVAKEIMQCYVGKYELIPGFVLTVSVEDEKLMVGATGQPTHQVFARSDSEWFYKVVQATLTFQVDEDGNCQSVELFQNGVRQKAKRID